MEGGRRWNEFHWRRCRVHVPPLSDWRLPGQRGTSVFSAVLMSNNLGTFLAALIGNRVQRQSFVRSFIHVTGLGNFQRALSDELRATGVKGVS